MLSGTGFVETEELNPASVWKRQDNTEEDCDQKEYWKLFMSRRWYALFNNTTYVSLLLPNLESFRSPPQLEADPPHPA